MFNFILWLDTVIMDNNLNINPENVKSIWQALPDMHLLQIINAKWESEQIICIVSLVDILTWRIIRHVITSTGILCCTANMFQLPFNGTVYRLFSDTQHCSILFSFLFLFLLMPVYRYPLQNSLYNVAVFPPFLLFVPNYLFSTEILSCYIEMYWKIKTAPFIIL
jgi:hypothetical protein